MPRAVFLAVGTRGDAAPLVVVASQFVRDAGGQWECCLVCDESCAEEFAQSNFQLKILPLRKSVLREESSRKGAGKEDEQEEPLSDAALSARRFAEMDEYVNECEGADLLVMNFFSLAGWHYAQQNDIPSVILSPCLLPHRMPPQFAEQFSADFPHLYKRLTRTAVGDGRISWGDVEHWLWRLFIDDHGDWREIRGMNPVPLIEFDCEDDAKALPRTTPVLYGVSPAVLERSSAWPACASLCGYWLADDIPEQFATTAVGQRLTSFLKTCDEPPICLTFGSMEELGVVSLGDDEEGIIARFCFATALNMVGRKGVLFHQKRENARCPVLSAETQQYLDKLHHLNDAILEVEESVPHSWLFPKISLLVHHGGSGTTGQALQAGLPQVVCPFMFDQKIWADKVFDLGVGSEPLPVEEWTPFSLGKAIDTALQPSVKNKGSQLSKAILNDNGVRVATEAIIQHFAENK